jgi:glutamate dehydrogenase/leucine dehydrogenase
MGSVIVVLPQSVSLVVLALETRGCRDYAGGNQTLALATLEEKIRRNTEAVLTQAAAQNIPPRQAALALAEARVRTAMSFQRRFFSEGEGIIFTGSGLPL